MNRSYGNPRRRKVPVVRLPAPPRLLRYPARGHRSTDRLEAWTTNDPLVVQPPRPGRTSPNPSSNLKAESRFQSSRRASCWWTMKVPCLASAGARHRSRSVGLAKAVAVSGSAVHGPGTRRENRRDFRVTTFAWDRPSARHGGVGRRLSCSWPQSGKTTDPSARSSVLWTRTATAWRTGREPSLISRTSGRPDGAKALGLALLRHRPGIRKPITSSGPGPPSGIP